MTIAEKQYREKIFAGSYNVGPDDSDCVTTGKLVETFCAAWGEGLTWESKSLDQPKEANFLKLDCSKIKSIFDWKPTWNIKTAVEKSVEWYKIYRDGGDLIGCMARQLKNFLEDGNDSIRTAQ